MGCEVPPCLLIENIVAVTVRNMWLCNKLF